MSGLAGHLMPFSEYRTMADRSVDALAKVRGGPHRSLAFSQYAGYGNYCGSRLSVGESVVAADKIILNNSGKCQGGLERSVGK